jgi:hypothetical protein
MPRPGISEVLLLLALILTISIPSLGQSPKDAPLTNADLVRLVKAGVSENTILRVMQVSETNFTTSASALIELKHHHVPDRVIDALLDTRGGTGGAIRNRAEPTTPDLTGTEPLRPGAHRLPNFDATVRIKGKTNAKIAVRQNHINVENAGHPLFSLSWKVNNAN